VRGATSALRRVPAWIALALLTGACAPLPPPGTTPVPPAAGGSPRTPPAPFRLDREPTIDVGIGIDLDSLTLVPPPRKSTSLVAGGANENVIGTAIGPITMRTTAAGWTLSWTNGSPEARSLGAADTVWIGVADTAKAASVRWQGKTWRGRLKLFLGPRGKLTLATRVPLETYLLGVVPAEIGALGADRLEAGRAQAIAARSYTLFYKGRRGTEGFDLYASVEDQVYVGIEDERPLATRCVETTRGAVAVSKLGPIRANYSSTCGGITADVWEAWPAEPMPYLVGHRDHGAMRDYCADSPHYRWREEWAAREFLSNLATYGPAEGIPIPADGPGVLEDVRVTSRSRSGRVWHLMVRTSSGRFDVPGQALRRVLRKPGNPRAILRSNLIKIDVRRDPRTRQALTVVASGAGSGHGVGLCQTGAIGMAKAGIDADHILLHYYHGAAVKRFY
jgi:stage II sporulation protein D